jgi:hypothetical protein
MVVLAVQVSNLEPTINNSAICNHLHIIRIRLEDTELGVSLGSQVTLDDLLELHGFINEKNRVEYIGIELAQIMREMFLKWADAYMKKSEGVDAVESSRK